MVGGSVIWLVLFVARASDVEVEVTVDGVDPAPSDSISLGDAAAREPLAAQHVELVAAGSRQTVAAS